MDKDISAAEANRHFSRILRDVRRGDAFTVTSRGEPVARIVPIDPEAERQRAGFAKLMTWLRSQPTLNMDITWSREDLYER